MKTYRMLLTSLPVFFAATVSAQTIDACISGNVIGGIAGSTEALPVGKGRAFCSELVAKVSHRHNLLPASRQIIGISRHGDSTGKSDAGKAKRQNT